MPRSDRKSALDAERRAAERVVVDLLGLPPLSSVDFVTGGQMATVSCLAAARHEVLLQAGWDVEADGLIGAPAVTVVVKAGAPAHLRRALRILGFGDRSVVTVDSDTRNGISPDALRRALARIHGPTIVAVECGDAGAGGFDNLNAVADLAELHEAGGDPTWVHVDGTVTLLAAASPDMTGAIAGLNRLDSWSADGHPMLNVAADGGIAICRHPVAYRAALGVVEAYRE
ncbi:hypothetical protein HH310_31570 [Actinoplanes sp. TBRC 11911]|uniref:pyridoxal-dependent decarboxylase n=1 Tax=Actinoplanes sp. TBRC 11911 TaxID=2729386 RepID=UPI00145D4263|nr:pyridoxal-dependent decarboxylase [Actinoplanes sp. TBRC 11911]NMO55710.1 hypothetical protein [Actinoplanes sp. TBRC 11911]